MTSSALGCILDVNSFRLLSDLRDRPANQSSRARQRFSVPPEEWRAPIVDSPQLVLPFESRGRRLIAPATSQIKGSKADSGKLAPSTATANAASTRPARNVHGKCWAAPDNRDSRHAQ